MSPKLPSSLFLLALVAAHVTVAAETRTVTREDAIRIAFANQPDLKVAAIQIDRAASRLRWSGRLENPELELNVSDDGVGLDEGEGNYEVAFAQRFPLTDRLRHEKGLRRHQVILAEAELAERRRELAGQVDLALIEWLSTRERGRLIAEAVTLNEEILRILEEQATAGEISKLDSMQAKLEARTLGQERDRLAAREKQERLGLLRLLGLEATTDLRLDASLVLPETAPPGHADLEAILSHRPDYVLALARIDQAKAALVLEESKRWEDVSLKFFVEGEKANDQPSGLERNTFTGIGLSIPLPLRQRNEDGVAQARLDGEESARSVDAARFRIRGECEEAYRARTDAWELASEAAGELPSLAKQQLEADISIATLVGFIAVGGVAARNGIMMISHYLHLMRHEGMEFGNELVARGTLERLVPVLMTALSAGIALIPLVLAAGEAGKEILHPVAVAIVGGLISSTLLDLVVTPAVFRLVGEGPANRSLSRDAPASC